MKWEPKPTHSIPKWVWVLIAVMAVLIAISNPGCATVPSASQVKIPSTPSMRLGVQGPCAQTWFDRIAGLSVLNWGGGLLILLGLVAIVGSFIPAIGTLFQRKMSLTCILAGIASIFLYNFLTVYAWIVYAIIGLGAFFMLLAYWPSIKAASVKIHELFSRNDEDGDGQIGPKFG